MATLQLPVYKDEPNAGDWLQGFDVFVIEITPQLARKYLAVMNAVRKTRNALKKAGAADLYQFRIWDYSGNWLPSDPDADPIKIVEIDELIQPPLAGAEPSRTEYDIAHVDADDIMWTACPKHGDCGVSTATVKRKVLEKILKEDAA